ncbi:MULTISPECIES: hypothetical protein [unclassified Acinetobacter]|nr:MULTISPECIES: hypothetical protein [unclassified Acinetobacter]MBK0062171.1 hypothetical protein [Acinetobacter sp. S55]MBK0065975.1 hypothetical protein [Acinetobacter sp. S54]
MRNKSHIDRFDTYLQIISFAIENKRRISSSDLIQEMGLTLRSAQRYLSDLVKADWLLTDYSSPRGYMPSDKAKKIFKVEV